MLITPDSPTAPGGGRAESPQRRGTPLQLNRADGLAGARSAGQGAVTTDTDSDRAVITAPAGPGPPTRPAAAPGSPARPGPAPPRATGRRRPGAGGGKYRGRQAQLLQGAARRRARPRRRRGGPGTRNARPSPMVSKSNDSG